MSAVSLRLLAACLACMLSATAATPAELSGDLTGISASRAGRPYSLLQTNLCLSGLAGCLRYPGALREAITVIGRRQPDVVTLNEVCRGDVARIAERTGYHRRFATVLYRGRPLACRRPSGRGEFGNAVLTRARISGSVDRRFTAQSLDPEERRWLCVTTVRRVTVCTAHLSGRGEARTATDRQCAELAHLLAVRARPGPTIAAGDINRHHSCAPAGMWTRTDRTATQNPGVQHAYGGAAHLRVVGAVTVPAGSTDHDFLYVRARLVPSPHCC